jgi:hypothetical protein
MASFSFICNSLLVIFLIITATTNYRASVKCLAITTGLAGLTSLFTLIAVSIFGAKADVYHDLDKFTGLGLDTLTLQGKWMPRPEYTFLSGSYICEVFCGIFSLVTSRYIY